MKQELLLHKLYEAKDYLSGEELCRQLGISRTGVWKMIRSLRKVYPRLTEKASPDSAMAISSTTRSRWPASWRDSLKIKYEISFENRL